MNIKQLALMLLPVNWRKPLIAGVTYAIVTPLSYIYMLFMGFKTETDYRLTHNGQVCHLRAVVNDLFDPIDRRITITDTGVRGRGLMIYQRDLDREVVVPMRSSGRAVIVNRRGFGGVNGYDFFVNIPIELTEEIDISRLIAIINTYKLASKRFAINYVAASRKIAFTDLPIGYNLRGKTILFTQQDKKPKPILNNTMEFSPSGRIGNILGAIVGVGVNSAGGMLVIFQLQNGWQVSEFTMSDAQDYIISSSNLAAQEGDTWGWQYAFVIE